MKLRTLRSMALALAASVSLSACVYPYADSGYADEGYADGYGYEDGYDEGYADNGYGSAYDVAYGGRYGWDSYCDPFYDRYYYAECDYYYGFGRIGWSGGYWSNYYYPGYGLWIFDRGGRRHRMDEHHRRYWGQKRHEFRNGRGDYGHDNYWNGLGQREREHRRGEWMRRRDAGEQPNLAEVYSHGRRGGEGIGDGDRHVNGRANGHEGAGHAPGYGRDTNGQGVHVRRGNRGAGNAQPMPAPMPELGARPPQHQRPEVADDGTGVSNSGNGGVNVVRQRPSMRRPRYEAETDAGAEQGRVGGWRREQPTGAAPAPVPAPPSGNFRRRNPDGNSGTGTGAAPMRRPSPERMPDAGRMRDGPRFDAGAQAPRAVPQAAPQAAPMRGREPVAAYQAPAPQTQAAPPQPRPAPVVRHESPRNDAIAPRRGTEGEP